MSLAGLSDQVRLCCLLASAIEARVPAQAFQIAVRVPQTFSWSLSVACRSLEADPSFGGGVTAVYCLSGSRHVTVVRLKDVAVKRCRCRAAEG